jgi:glycosyltransferase involved in cell wall biosynthesis
MSLKNNKLKVALLFDESTISGGGFYHSIHLTNLYLNSNEKNLTFEIISTKKDSYSYLLDKNYPVKYKSFNYFDKFVSMLTKNFFMNSFFSNYFNFSTPIDKYFNNNKYDLIIFLSPTYLIKYISNINYFSSVWDLCHLQQPEFPEVAKKNIFLKRENILFKHIRRSAHIICESIQTKNNLIKKYGVDEDRISFMPLNGSPMLSHQPQDSNINNSLICQDYIFYPAQFWAHKNHIYLLKGLKDYLKRHKKDLNLIFAGSDKGNMEYVKEYVKVNNLNENVFFLDFVSDNDMSFLYKNCSMVVMPSYFGPTNMPPIEAFYFSKPVIYSDLEYMREQFGDSVIYCDLENPRNLSDSIHNLLNDNKLRVKLIQKGKKFLEENDLNSKESFKKIIKKIKSYQFKRDCWK